MLNVVPGEGTEPLNSCQYWILGGTDGLYRCLAHCKTNTDVIMFLPFFPPKDKNPLDFFQLLKTGTNVDLS